MSIVKVAGDGQRAEQREENDYQGCFVSRYLKSYWASLRGHFPTQNKPGVLSQDGDPSKGQWIGQPRPQAAR